MLPAQTRSNLGSCIQGLEYHACGSALPSEVEERRQLIDRFLTAHEVPVTNPKKRYDVRPAVTSARATEEGLCFEIAFSADRGSARPLDVIHGILGTAPDHVDVHKSDTIFLKTG